jgi:hypothetical protein
MMMTTHSIGRPRPTEYPLHAQGYVDLVPGDDAVKVLVNQAQLTRTLLESLGDERAGSFRYATDKWTAKEVLGHLADTERILAYRALRLARGDRTPLPGFEQNDYVTASHANLRTLTDLLSEWQSVRASTVALFRSFPGEAWTREGIVSDRQLTVRGIAYTAAGHELHHYRILQEKYAARS